MRGVICIDESIDADTAKTVASVLVDSIADRGARPEGEVEMRAFLGGSMAAGMVLVSLMGLGWTQGVEAAVSGVF
ncbi:hypothetical protein [Marichromatium bheemlicum]|uniref:Uncharacterized protein n=1 Tax=Marichromatium bheemlicum TaxID=365339 RepID=A0ABX1I7B2_9GAMM|nr:hypothetical protein [Marichromatium bheemlicum]NKN32127.1 hypothetical protein [Marichromatium bheemlicum]